jgi:hypothetical protein
MASSRKARFSEDQILEKLWEEEDLEYAGIESDLDSDSEDEQQPPDKVYTVDVLIQV